jgi:hypothetical protein
MQDQRYHDRFAPHNIIVTDLDIPCVTSNTSIPKHLSPAECLARIATVSRHALQIASLMAQNVQCFETGIDVSHRAFPVEEWVYRREEPD